MLRKLRLLSILMVFSLLAGQICIANVSAAEGVTVNAEVKELSGLRITDLDKPVTGKELDRTARIRTDQNVTWEIPVIWTDENGNTATEAVSGKKYFPHFAFFVPEGYRVSTTDAGRFSVRFPAFLTELFGEESAVFVADASQGVIYISFLQSIPEKSAVNNSRAAETQIAQNWQQSTQQQSDDDDDDDDSSGSTGSPAAVEEVDQVRIHCSQGAIETLGRDLLEEIVTLVKNKLEPQAVHLLKTSFDAYNNALQTELGRQIGLYIYYDGGLIDRGNGQYSNAPADALAFVSGGYVSELNEAGNSEAIYKYVLALDTKSFVERDDTGRWVIKENENDNLDNTIVHEMMHAFMDDFTRRGMAGGAGEQFPTWFTEGMASAVENVYQFRARQFQLLGVEDNENQFNSLVGRFNNRVTYSDASIASMYGNTDLTGDNRYDLAFSNDEDNTGSAYVSGYLAVVYLSYLAAVRNGVTGVITTYTNPDDENDVTTTVDIEKIRQGTDSILDWLHRGDSLDSIISFVSSLGQDEDHNDINPAYLNTADFTNKFIKGVAGSNDEGNPAIRSSETTSFMGSLAFCSTYLNYLESVSDYGENTDYRNLANGSLLNINSEGNRGQNYSSPLDHDREMQTDLYNIVDSQSYVASTVDDDFAFDRTGGTSVSGDADDEQTNTGSKVVSFPGSEQGEGAAAAKTGDTSSSDSDEGAEEAVSNIDTPAVTGSEEIAVAVDEPVATPEPEAIPPVDPAVSGIVPSAQPENILPEGEVSQGGEEFSILPVQQDAIVPDEQQIVPVETSSDPEPCGGSDSPEGDSGSSDEGSSDSGSDDGGSSDEGGSSEEG